MKTRFLTRAVIALAALMIAIFAIPEIGAVEPLQVDLNDIMSLEELMNIPVFGASRYEQKTTEAPSSVSIVMSRDIRKYGYRTLADIIRSQRGFYVNYDRNYSYIGARGFLRPGDYNSRVLLLVDGHRTNDALYDSAAIDTSFILDVDLIDRVEFIRGPSSSLYGSNAFFGVINVITKTGKAYQGAELSGEAGSFETYKARATYGNRWGSGIQGVFSGTWYDSEGDDRLFFKEFNDPLTNNGIAENADGDKYYSFFTTLSWRDFTLQGAYNERDKDIPTAPWDTFFNDNRTMTRDGLAYVVLKYDRYFGRGWNVQAKASYNDYWYDGDYVYDWNEDPLDPDLVVNRDEARGKWVGGEVTFRKKMWEKHKVTFGTEYRNNFQLDQKNFDPVDPPVIYLDDQRDSDFWALYFQDEFEIFQGLLLNAGVRFDHYSTFGGTTNPRIGLIANPIPSSTFKLLYGRAFRAPSAYELYYNDGGDTQKANPDLDPETIDTYELVYEQFLGNNVRATVTGFYYKIEDLINQVIDPADDILVFRNLASAESHGATIELEGRWENGFEGRASYTYQMSEDDSTGQELENSPRHLAKINLTAPLLKEKLFAGAEAQYTSSRKTVQGNRTGGFWVTNLTLTSARLWNRVALSASVYNLFDKEYGDPGSTEHLQDVIEQDGRTFRVKVTASF
jgi:iron complex outermembrane receptor protein